MNISGRHQKESRSTNTIKKRVFMMCYYRSRSRSRSTNRNRNRKTRNKETNIEGKI